MTIPQNPIEIFTPFLPSTFNVPEEKERLKLWLGEKFSQVSDVVNDKKIGAYTQSVSSQNGNKFSYDTTSKIRNGFQYLLRIPSFPNTSSATYPVPPEMSAQFAIFQIWGSASKAATTPGTADYFSFYGSGNPKITFTFSDLAIVVTTTLDMTAYSGFICIDFIADGM